MKLVTVVEGEGPVILGQPHCGTFIPDDIAANLNELGQQLSDTDWHIDQLYDGLLERASIVRAEFHRYVIDPNRDPSGQSLYQGQNTTGLVPETTFDDQPIWVTPLSAEDIERRLAYHKAYHQALQAQIDRVRSKFGVVVLYDCHSIRSVIPNLFGGRLPDLNLGNDNSATCAASLMQALVQLAEEAGDYSHVVNGRFRGGWTTRYYGQPSENVHAVQMELAQRCYLESEKPPYAYSAEKAAPLRKLLKAMLEKVETFALTLCE